MATIARTEAHEGGTCPICFKGIHRGDKAWTVDGVQYFCTELCAEKEADYYNKVAIKVGVGPYRVSQP